MNNSYLEILWAIPSYRRGLLSHRVVEICKRKVRHCYLKTLRVRGAIERGWVRLTSFHKVVKKIGRTKPHFPQWWTLLWLGVHWLPHQSQQYLWVWMTNGHPLIFRNRNLHLFMTTASLVDLCLCFPKTEEEVCSANGPLLLHHSLSQNRLPLHHPKDRTSKFLNSLCMNRKA